MLTFFRVLMYVSQAHRRALYGSAAQPSLSLARGPTKPGLQESLLVLSPKRKGST